MRKMSLVGISDPPIHTKAYSSFRGVDFSTDPTMIDDSRSPWAVNMIADEGGYPCKRIGWRSIYKASGRINGLFFFDAKGKKVLIAHIGTAVFEVSTDGKTQTQLLSGITDGKSRGFYFNASLFILTGGEYLVYDGVTVKQVAEKAFIPTTSINRTATGGGTDYQNVNMLQPRRKNTFITDGTSTSFQLDATNLDFGSPVRVILNGIEQTSGFSVDFVNGKVNFSAAPAKGANEGVPMLSVEFQKTNAEYVGVIQKCTISAMYGLNNDNRVFLSANPQKANVEFYSALNDPSYFPDINYNVIGTSDFPIVGYIKVAGELTVVKKQNDQEGTIYYHSAEMTTDKGAVFPVREGVSGVGGIAMDCCLNFLDDPLFLSPRGVFAVTTNYYSAKLERGTANRSKFINTRLTKEKNLADAICTVWNGFFVLCVNNRCYLADSRQNRSSDGYEWYHWDNVPARCLMTWEDALFFGTEDGRICRFNTDIKTADGDFLMTAYNDDGEAIKAQWATKLDTDGDIMRYKSMPKRGSGVHLRADKRSSADIYIRTENDFGVLKRRTTSDIFDWTDIAFERMVFTVTPDNMVSFRSKVKNYVAIQIVIKNEEVNDSFGVFGIVRRFTVGKYVKK